MKTQLIKLKTITSCCVCVCVCVAGAAESIWKIFDVLFIKALYRFLLFCFCLDFVEFLRYDGRIGTS